MTCRNTFALRLHVCSFRCEKLRSLNLATRGLWAPSVGKGRLGAAGCLFPPPLDSWGRPRRLLMGRQCGPSINNPLLIFTTSVSSGKTTSLPAVSMGSSLGLEQTRRGALVRSRPMWHTFYYMRPRCLGCEAWRSRRGQSGLGRRHLVIWRSACSKPCPGSTRSTMCVACVGAFLTGSAR